MRLPGSALLRRWLVVLSLVTVAVPCSTALAQSQRGQPRRAFSTADFARLKWIEGTWESTAPGETTFYERYQFANDSTVEITYFSDPALKHETGNGRLYLSVGRVVHTVGPARWGATHIDENSVFFVPQANAQNTFSWSMRSPDAWTATMRMGLSGHDRVTVYELRRIGKR